MEDIPMAKKSNVPPKSYEYKVIEEISHNDTAGGGTRLCVARWLIDGQKTNPILERRSYWKVPQGTKMDKAKGLNGQDFLMALENLERVGQALEIPFKLIEEAVAKGLNATIQEPKADEAVPWS
jgi:hypothetical protein